MQRLTEAELDLVIARFGSVEEAHRVLVAAEAPLGVFAATAEVPELHGVPAIGPLVDMPHRSERHRLEKIRMVLGPRLTERVVELELAYQRENERALALYERDAPAEEVEERAALLGEELFSLYEAFNEGGEAQFTIPAPGTEDLEISLLRTFYEYEGGFGRFGPEPRTADLIEALRSTLTYAGYNIENATDQEVFRMADEIALHRAETIAMLRESARTREVPEHVRIAHEIAKIKASQLPRATRDKILGRPSQLVPNADSHPAVDLARRVLAGGGSRAEAMHAVARRGYPPFAAYMAAEAASLEVQ